jgi:hypothetical protein
MRGGIAHVAWFLRSLYCPVFAQKIRRVKCVGYYVFPVNREYIVVAGRYFPFFFFLNSQKASINPPPPLPPHKKVYPLKPRRGGQRGGGKKRERPPTQPRPAFFLVSERLLFSELSVFIKCSEPDAFVLAQI